MHNPGRLAASVCLAVVALLAVGALVLSIVTAPASAQTRLRGAAATTATASGFELELSYGQRVSGVDRLARAAAIDYRAPDRVAISQTPAYGGEVQVAIGTRAWVSSNQGKSWQPVGAAEPGSSIGANTAAQLLSVPVAIERVTGVTGGGDHLSFTTTDPGLLEALGDQGGKLAAGEHVRVNVVLAGDVLGSVNVVVSRTHHPPGLARFRFSHVGDSPPVNPPPASAVKG